MCADNKSVWKHGGAMISLLIWRAGEMELELEMEIEMAVEYMKELVPFPLPFSFPNWWPCGSRESSEMIKVRTRGDNEPIGGR